MTAMEGLAVIAREAPLVFVTMALTVSIGVYVVAKIVIEAVMSMLQVFGVLLITLFERSRGEDRGRMDSWL